MKILALALLTLALALPLRADDAIQNGDFTDGTAHWHGNCRSPADFATDNPLAKPDPLTSKGMIIPIKHTSWAKVAQDFTPKDPNGILTVTYMISPDLAFSTKDDDYTDVPRHLDWGWQTFKTKPGAWLIFLHDSTGTKGTRYEITPNATPGVPQTCKVKMVGLSPSDKSTLTFALPPGTGTVVILNVSLTGS